MPALNAALTLKRTVEAIPSEWVDEIVLVDDASSDETVELARSLPLHVVWHPHTAGYGANQKTCYLEALRLGADVVVMLHPDYQYEPRLVTPMASMISSGVYDMVLGSRILGGTAMSGGMPLWKYAANRILTAVENMALGSKLSEFHTGFRAYSREALLAMPLLANSDDFVFDNQLIAQAVALGLRIGEISCPTSYHGDASSINFSRSVRYGLGVLATSAAFVAWRLHLARPRIFANRQEDRISSRLAATT